MNEIKTLTAEEQVASVLAADQRRMRRLTWVTVSLWLITILSTAFLIFLFQKFSDFANHTHNTYRHQRELEPIKAGEMTPEQLAVARVVSMNAQVTWSARFVIASITLLSLSALGTILLVHASRRATLRQIQVSLATIARQLDELKQAGNPPKPTMAV